MFANIGFIDTFKFKCFVSYVIGKLGLVRFVKKCFMIILILFFPCFYFLFFLPYEFCVDAKDICFSIFIARNSHFKIWQVYFIIARYRASHF